MLLAGLAIFSGCTPPGPRALLDGQKLIEQGKYPQAVEKLKKATSLLATNAPAWNYLGLAHHYCGQTVDAEKAYHRALALNHDLTEAHYNLGCLLLAQNRTEAAKSELTACILRRGDSVEALLKLGTAELRLHNQARPRDLNALQAAEKSFSNALRLNSRNPEALNGLGLVRLQRGRAKEAMDLFNSALKQQPDYRPALLNLAIVLHQYSKDVSDHKAALQKYRQYLASKPPPENLGQIKAIVQQLEHELTPSPRPATNSLAHTPAKLAPPAASTTEVLRFTNTQKFPAQINAPKPATASVTNTSKTNSALGVAKPVIAPAVPPNRRPENSAPSAAASTNVELVKLTADPVLKPAQEVANIPAPQPLPLEPLASNSSPTAHAAGGQMANHGLLQRINPLNLFRSDNKSAAQPTPLPSAEKADEIESINNLGRTGTEENASAAAKAGPGRYPYQVASKPVPGDRSAAERAFAQGLQAQQGGHLPEAIQAYRRAAQMDPSYFEAYYNLGLAAAEAGKLDLCLRAYEMALCLRPESRDARYNFALALKQADYLMDAADELEKVLARFPNEARAHLALANLYAQQLRQPAKAREHYLKVVETDPHNPQASAIHYWLVANPK